MHCSHCQHRMYQTAEVVESRAKQTWYRCPVCDHVHTTSEPYRPPTLRLDRYEAPIPLD